MIDDPTPSCGDMRSDCAREFGMIGEKLGTIDKTQTDILRTVTANATEEKKPSRPFHADDVRQ